MESLIFIVMIGILIWHAMVLWVRRQIDRQILKEEIAAELERRLPVQLNIEEINGMVYGWDHQTNDFVCQGKDLEEFRSNFRSRFPDRNAAIIDGPAELMSRMKQELKLIKENENLSSQ